MTLEEPSLVSGPLDISSLPSDIVYVGAAGFEDRAMAFLNHAGTYQKTFGACLALDYRPYDKRNRRKEFAEKASGIFGKVSWLTYDRFQPESFSRYTVELLKLCNAASEVVVDISAMSKMLVIVLLYNLRQLDRTLILAYFPAEIYHPLEDEYKAKSFSPEASPVFLTSDVFTVVTTSALSSIAMQGAPLVMVAFPNFNYLELMALLNEVNPQHLTLVEGVPNPELDSWRLDAVRRLNRSVETYLKPGWEYADPISLKSNVELLDRIYERFQYTHKVVLAPTGSKLQAVASFCLKVMHPDVHIVYPVVRKFAQDYTQGYRDPSRITLGNFRRFVSSLDHHRTGKLMKMKEEIGFIAK